MKKYFKLIYILLISNTFISIGQQTFDSYSILNKFHVEGDGSWDYISFDNGLNRLFVSHGMITQVLDANDGKLLKTIENTKGVHGIALSQNLNKVFISCGRDSSVSILDYTTLELKDKIKIPGKNPDAIIFDTFSNKLFTFNGGSSNATVIDAISNKIIGNISLDGKPEFAAIDGKGKLYVNIEDKSMISEIDTKQMKVLKSWSLAPGEEPSGLAFDAENNLLFSVCSNKIMTISDATKGKVIQSLPIGERTDGCVYDPELKKVYSSNGEGTITIIVKKHDRFEVETSVTSQKGARTICLNPKNHHIYLPTAEYGATPEPTLEHPKPRPSIMQGTFVVLEFGPVSN